MIEAFPMVFGPADAAVQLLVQIANSDSPHAEAAKAVVEDWRECLATPDQIAKVETSDELEIDDAGACISQSDDGYFIQTWTWIKCDGGTDAEDEDETTQA